MCLPSARKLAPVMHILGIYREYVALAPRLFDNTRFTDHPSWTYIWNHGNNTLWVANHCHAWKMWGTALHSPHAHSR